MAGTSRLDMPEAGFTQALERALGQLVDRGHANKCDRPY